jgi:hypothetical protein
MLTRTFFSFQYLNDIKSLSGFVKGGRDKVPKDFSEYHNKQIAKWAEAEIKDHVEALATKAKNFLDISARDFKTPNYEPGLGSYACQFFTYNFSATQDDEDFSTCKFSGLLEIEKLEGFDEIQSKIDYCFNYKFNKAVSSFPKGHRDLKELIYTLDDNKKTINAIFDFSYENDFSYFQLVHKKDRTLIKVDDSAIEINFNANQSISDMLCVVEDINQKIFSPFRPADILMSELPAPEN